METTYLGVSCRILALVAVVWFPACSRDMARAGGEADLNRDMARAGGEADLSALITIDMGSAPEDLRWATPAEPKYWLQFDGPAKWNGGMLLGGGRNLAISFDRSHPVRQYPVEPNVGYIEGPNVLAIRDLVGCGNDGTVVPKLEKLPIGDAEEVDWVELDIVGPGQTGGAACHSVRLADATWDFDYRQRALSAPYSPDGVSILRVDIHRRQVTGIKLVVDSGAMNVRALRVYGPANQP